MNAKELHRCSEVHQEVVVLEGVRELMVNHNAEVAGTFYFAITGLSNPVIKLSAEEVDLLIRRRVNDLRRSGVLV